MKKEKLSPAQPIEENVVLFMQGNKGIEILKLCANGDIFVHSKLVENDKEVVDAFREFLKLQDSDFD